MEIRESNDPGQWDVFVGSQPESQFLQSYIWGEFQKIVGKRVIRIAVAENGSILGIAQCLFTQHGFGVNSFALYRGPIINQSLSPNIFQECFHMLMSRVVEVSRECGATYIHWEPAFALNSPEALMAKELKGWMGVGSSQPNNSLLLSLSDSSRPLPSPLHILPKMHEKTRYNIRLAERKGVRVEHGTLPEFVEHFLRLSHVTARRERIHIHSNSYYRKMIEVLGERGIAEIFVAFSPDPIPNPLAANIVLSFGDTVTYVHGASSNEQRNVMAPHLLQWKQIEWAVEQGKRWYDFWGVAPNDDPNHSWAGITRFKRGFGGTERHYAPACEMPLAQIKYRFIQLRRRLR